MDAEVQTVRNTTSPPGEMDVAFSWLVEKQPIYHATAFLNPVTTPLKNFAREKCFVLFADKRCLPEIFSSRKFPGYLPGKLSSFGTLPVRGSSSNTTRLRCTVNRVFPASAHASSVSHGVRFQPANVCR